MRTRLTSQWIKALLGLAGLACINISPAALLTYSVQFSESHNQDSDGPPTGPESDYFLGSMFADTAGDLGFAYVYRPDLMSIGLYPSDPIVQTYVYGYSSGYTSTSDLLADYPAGDYGFQIAAGNLGPAFENLTVFGDDFPNEAPYLTGGTYSALQMAPAGADGPISWNTFTHPGLGETQAINTNVTDLTGAIGYVYGGGGPADLYLSDTIPGDVLRSGHTYSCAVAYYSYTESPNQGFGGATSIVSYVRQTSAQFHLAANPGTVSGQLVLGDYYYPLGKTVTVEVVGDDGVEDTQTIVVGYDGWYAFDTASSGVKTITFDRSQFLKRDIPNVDLNVGQDALNVTLLNGDVDDDNEVAIGDYAILSTAFGSVPGDGNWIEQADLNGDLEVNIGDYAILSQNFGQVGDD
jgi:hypothetical protein